MKQKILVFMLLLAAVLAGVLAGCSKEEKGPDALEEPQEGAVTDPYQDYQAGSYARIMAGGTYYMECSYYVMGIESVMRMAVRGAQSDVTVGGIGFPVRIILKDGKAYTLNEEKKVYTVSALSSEPAASQENGLFDYSGLAFSQKGQSAISALEGTDGASYPYEEFLAGTGGERIRVRYYFKGDALYAVEIQGAGTPVAMVIKTLTAAIPPGMLEIPGDFRETDPSGLF